MMVSLRATRWPQWWCHHADFLDPPPAAFAFAASNFAFACAFAAIAFTSATACSCGVKSDSKSINNPSIENIENIIGSPIVNADVAVLVKAFLQKKNVSSMW